MTPARLTKPYVGLSPATPHIDAGIRIEPPVSEPRAKGRNPAATAAAAPVLEPPVACSVFHGLRAGGHGKSNDGPPFASSCVASLPMSTAPHAYRRAIAVASAAGTLSRNARE